MSLFYDVNGQLLQVGNTVNIPCIVVGNLSNPDAKGIVQLQLQTLYPNMVSGSPDTITIRANLTERRD